jgi:hypothetical protein
LKDLNPSLSYFQRQTKAGHAFQVVSRLPFVARDCFEHISPLIIPVFTFLSQTINPTAAWEEKPTTAPTSAAPAYAASA